MVHSSKSEYSFIRYQTYSIRQVVIKAHPRFLNMQNNSERSGKKCINLQEFFKTMVFNNIKRIPCKYAIPTAVLGIGTSIVFLYMRQQNMQQATVHNIYDLEEIAKKKAKSIWDGQDITFDFSGVKFISDPPEIEPRKKDQSKSNVFFRASFKNESEHEQSHALRTERQSSATCESSLFKGYKFASDIGLSVMVPGEILNVAIEAFNEFVLKDGGSKQESKLSWVIKESVKVPKKSSVTVEMKTTEINPEFYFHTWVALKGEVIGTFYNKKKEVKRTIKIPMSTIVEDFPENMKKVENDVHYIKVSGMCKMKYEIDFEIITQSPILLSTVRGVT